MPARQPRTGGKTSGGQQSAKKTTGAVSAAAFEKHLHGIQFPADKNKIITHLKSSKATPDITNIANHFQDKKYTNAADVAKEFGRVKREQT